VSLPEDVRSGAVCVGSFTCFGDAWLECLRTVMRHGHDIVDDEQRLREVVNLTVSAATCDSSDFIRYGASPDRIQLMLRKYHSLVAVPPYTVSYGSLFRRHEGVDQIAWLVSRLCGKMETKSATIGFHTPGCNELSCISLFDCKVRDHKLHVSAVYRSQNVFASQPGNVVALSRFQEEIARRLGVSVGSMTLHILSAHVYQCDFIEVEAVMNSYDHHGCGVNGERADGATAGADKT
jgi:thymidylate synthase